MNSPQLDCTALRQRRESLGLTQSDLAGRAGLSRQTINAVETGRTVPAIDVALQIASALAAPVESLFRLPPGRSRRRVDVVSTVPAESRPGTRVVLAQIGDRLLSYPLSGDRLTQPADGVLHHGRGGTAQVELHAGADLAHETVVLAGCAPALGLLAAALNQKPGAGRFLWLPLGSTAALQALGAGQAHVAGVHLYDPASGEANLPDVKSHSGPGARLLLTLARWEIGLVLPPGNPLRLRSLRLLFSPSRRGARASRGRAPRFVCREPGSGVHRLLAAELTQGGLPAERLLSRLPVAHGHLEVAQAVALGAADVGVATRDAAQAYRLDFVPLRQERYDLVLPSDLLTDRRIARLLDTLTAAGFRRDLTSLGYDARPCGSRVAEVHAA